MFVKFKVLTLDQMSDKFEYSVRTVQRQLTKLAVLRSYNKNSRYYTLPDIPEFNSDGIWRFKDILFSKFGNLRNTVKQLILESEHGLNGNEIGGILNLLPRSFMHHFRNMEGIFREKHGGVYVYFSDDPAIYAKQKFNRVRAIDTQKIGDADAVKILVGYIKHPELSETQLSEYLMDKQGCYISASKITNLLLFHGLLKKTPDF